MACRELLKGGGLSIDKLTEERAPLSYDIRVLRNLWVEMIIHKL